MEPVFTARLGDRIEEGKVTIGNYDGKGPCITCATPSGKILIHNPRKTAKDTISSLNLQKKISGLLAGPMANSSENDGPQRDILYIGSSHDLLAYDVLNNKDIYHKELPEGVLAMAVGKFGAGQRDFVFAGGNCSLHGFDAEGNDTFWTVTSDNVCSIAMCDLLGEGHNQLIAGSEDCDMRVFLDGADVLHEFSETEAVKSLCDMGGCRFAYCLDNGSVGAYDGPNKAWRVKMKSKPVCILDFDMTMDGYPELVTGWADGTLDVRSDRGSDAGKILVKDKFPSAIAGIVKGDYRGDGTSMLIAVSVDGEVRGYLPLGAAPAPPRALSIDESVPVAELSPGPSPPKGSTKKKKSQKHTPSSSSPPTASVSAPINTEATDRAIQEAEDIRRINAELQARIDVLEQRRQQIILSIEAQNLMEAVDTSLTKPNLRIAILQVAAENRCQLIFDLPTAQNTKIVSIVLQGDGISPSSMIVHFPSPNHKDPQEGIINLRPSRNTTINTLAKVVISSNTEAQLVVHEMEIAIPRFAMLAPQTAEMGLTQPESYAKLPIKGRSVTHLIKEWLETEFVVPTPKLETSEGKKDFVALMYCMRTQSQLVVQITEHFLFIRTDNIELAGDITHALLEKLNIENMDSEIHFPVDVANFSKLFEKVLELKSIRQRISASIAEKSELAKGLLFQSEDCRSLKEFDSMQRAYHNLHTLNLDLVSQYHIRCTNHTELIDSLKAINTFIQHASRLRAGVPQADVVRGCRNAIKEGNNEALERVVRYGPTKKPLPLML